jgi:hypothetical protein
MEMSGQLRASTALPALKTPAPHPGTNLIGFDRRASFMQGCRITEYNTNIGELHTNTHQARHLIIIHH